jgi:hypothetical protein
METINESTSNSAKCHGTSKRRVDDWRGDDRYWGVAVCRRLLSRSGASIHTVVPFPVAAHQTGRAVFPHPAFGRDHAFAHAKPLVFFPRCMRP